MAEYYNPNLGRSSCIACHAGMLCDTTAMTAPLQCIAGHYCPAKTSLINNEQLECPPGTYSEILGLGSKSDCIPCPTGKYCNSGTSLKSDAIDCDEKFFCPIGSSAGTGYGNVYEFGVKASGICPAGYTCEAATLAPEPCPVGQY